MPDRVRLEALEALDAIARHGSFAAAAAALYRVPSAISYTIARLEEELGVAVFDRSGHRAILTPAGRLLLDEGRRILAASAELGAAARRVAADWEPELRLVVDGLIDPLELAPAIADFERVHSDIDLRISEETLGGTWEALIDDRADLAIGAATVPSGAGLRRRRYRRIDFVFCAAPSHPLAQLPYLDADTIRAHRAVVVADSARRLAPRSSALLDGQPRLTVAHMHSKIRAIEAGLGVGYCPANRVAAARHAGRLVALSVPGQRPPLDSWLLWRRPRPGRALAWFIERLARQDAATAQQ